MFELLLVCLGIYWLATDTSTALWVIGGVLALMLVAALADGKKGRKRPSGKPVRIDRPHYFDEDDHECSVCGCRFRGKGMVCPKCGARFAGTREDDGEFIEEMVIWDDDD